MNDKSTFVGVDLGNAYSRVAHARYSDQQGRYGEAQVICPAAGRPYVRSILARNLDDEQELGDEIFISGAAAARPETVRTIDKGKLATDQAAQDDVTAILAELYLATAKVLGNEGLAAATVVAGVDKVEGDGGGYGGVLLQALARAGFGGVQLVPEGLAAFAYHHQRGDLPASPEPGRYLVFNFGADHTDCTVLDVAAGAAPTVTATTMDKYGGREFDAAIAAWILRCFASSTPRTAADPELLHFAESLKQAYCERLKAGQTYVEQFCELPGINAAIRLTQADFNTSGMAFGLQAECMGAVMKLLREAGVKVNEPAGVILAGGNARWGFVQQQVLGLFQNARYRLVSEAPEETIVKGLAVVKAVEEPAVIPAMPQLVQEEVTRQPDVVGIAPITPAQPVDKPQPARPAPPALRQPPPKRPPSPRTAGNLELLGWLGMLGLGWIYGGKPLRGVFALVTWWALIILGIVGTGALMVTQSPWYLAGAVATWLAVPLLSRGLVRRQVRRQLPPPPPDHTLEA